MTNHANDAARYLNERITPDPQASTTYLEQLSDTLSAEALRDRLNRRPLVKHPDRSNTWVRSIFPDRDLSTNGPSLLGAPLGPGRESFGGEAA